MTLLDILIKAEVGAAGLVSLLEKVSAEYPDLKPLADEWLVKLNSATSAENLVALAAALPAEIANIAQGKFTPADHPSDAI